MSRAGPGGAGFFRNSSAVRDIARVLSHAIISFLPSLIHSFPHTLSSIPSHPPSFPHTITLLALVVPTSTILHAPLELQPLGKHGGPLIPHAQLSLCCRMTKEWAGAESGFQFKERQRGGYR